MESLLGLLSSPSKKGGGVVADVPVHTVLGKCIPRTFAMLKDGDKSPYLIFLKTVCSFVTDLQFHCLPLVYRSIGVQNYLSTEKERRKIETEERFLTWSQKEKRYLLEAGYNTDRLHSEKKEVLQAVRRVIFALIHHEQRELQQEDACLPFISIWNEEGEVNPSYDEQLAKAKKFKIDHLTQTLGSEKEFIDKVEGYFEGQLKTKGCDPQAFTPEQKKLADAAKASALQAMLKASYELPDTAFENLSLLFRVTISNEKGVDLAYWQALEKTRETVLAVRKLAQKHKEYATLQEKLFQEAYGYDYSSLSEELRRLADAARKVLFRVILQEQQELGGSPSSLPFVSIFTEQGEINRDFWIDLINAKGKQNGEKPKCERTHLKEFWDFDVLRTVYGHRENATKEDSIRKESEAAIAPFCQNVVNSVSKAMDILGRRVHTSITKEEERLKELFQGSSFTLTEKLLCFQNKFIDLFIAIHFTLGHSDLLLSKIEIPFTLEGPKLLFLDQMEEGCRNMKQWIAGVQQISKSSPVPEIKSGSSIAIFLDSFQHSLDDLRLLSTNLKTFAVVLELFAAGLLSPTLPIEISTPRRRRNLSMDQPLSGQEGSPRQGGDSSPRVTSPLRARIPRLSNPVLSPRMRAVSDSKPEDSPRIGDGEMVLAPNRFKRAAPLCTYIQEVIDMVTQIMESELGELNIT